MKDYKIYKELIDGSSTVSDFMTKGGAKATFNRLKKNLNNGVFYCEILEYDWDSDIVEVFVVDSFERKRINVLGHILLS